MAKTIIFQKRVKEASDWLSRCSTRSDFEVEDVFDLTWIKHQNNIRWSSVLWSKLGEDSAISSIHRGVTLLPKIEGWVALRESWRSINLANQIQVAVQSSSKELPVNVDTDPELSRFTAYSLYGLILLDETSLAEWTALHLAERGQEPDVLPSHLFACALRAILSGDDGRLAEICSREEIDIYKGILDAWEDDAALKEAMEGALDHHADEVNDFGEFDLACQDIWPIEFSTLLHVRNKLGLSTPKVDHHYTKSPCWNLLPPEKLPPYEDPLREPFRAMYIKEGFLEESIAEASKRAPRKGPSKKSGAKKTAAAKKKPTSVSQLESAIADSDEAAAMKCKECFVLDWRENPAEIFAYFDSLISGNAFSQTDGPDDGTVTITFLDRKKKIPVVSKKKTPVAMDVLEAVARLIRPEYDTRVFKSTAEDDTIVTLTQTADWWSKMEKANSRAVKAMFKKV